MPKLKTFSNSKLKTKPLRLKRKPKQASNKVTAYLTKREEEMFLRKTIECLTRKIFTQVRTRSGETRKRFAEILGFSSPYFTERVEVPRKNRWFFSPKIKEAYSRYMGVSVSAVEAATEYVSMLLHEELDDLSVVEGIDNEMLLNLVKAMDTAQRKVWDSYHRTKIQELIDVSREVRDKVPKAARNDQ